jgi:replicative superfamily II helicase
VEALFSARRLRVLCTTSTLATGARARALAAH